MTAVVALPQPLNTSTNNKPADSISTASSSSIDSNVPLMASASSPSGQNLRSSSQQPMLLTLEQQQELLDQLAQLQRQTQQLLAAQQSLAAVAAAAAVNGNNNGVSIGTPLDGNSNNDAGSHSPITSGSIQYHRQQNQQQTHPTTQQLNNPTSNQQSAAIRNDNIDQGSLEQSQSKSNQLNQMINNAQNSQSQSMSGLPQSPQINWGKCPELEPSEQEKLAKANVITKCLETTPLPANITRESVEQHREQIAGCALRSEGWFTPNGGYDFSKAEKEIRNKHLQADLENQVLNYHGQCRVESEEKYPTSNSSIIAQIQLYQACMDYFISDVCGIEVNDTDSPQF